MRIAVLGLGFMGTTHLKAYKSVPDAEIVAVASEDEKKLGGDLSQVQGNLGGPGEKFDFSGVRKYRELLGAVNDADVEAVDICLPTHLHSPIALAALRAGKHVLVEKPMALTEGAATEMLGEAGRSGKILMVGQVLRFVPAYRAVRTAILSGEFGEIRSVFLRRRCAAPFWNLWLGDVKRSGGGIFDLLIHDVDFAIHLFGSPDRVSATGYEDLEGGIDTITATLQWKDRAPAVVITGGWQHKKAYPFSMEFTVTTDGATFEFDSAQGEGVTVYGADGESRPLSMDTGDPFAAELAYFVECCKEGKRPDFCLPQESAEAVRVTRLMLEARKADGVPVQC
jgi:predicted dehydrogenase